MKKILGQDLNSLAKVAEIMAAVAIVVSLVFVGIQLQQNNKLLVMQGSHVLLENRIRGRIAAFEDPEISEFLFRLQSEQGISEVDEFRNTQRIEASILQYEWEYIQFLNGNISEIPLEGYRSNFRNPRQRETFLRMAAEDDFSSQEFVDWVRTELLPED